ncbi:MAG: hypothetical protein OXI10_06885 [Gammaproteobacteria bacterium]|nr:hypothetical protein [Gammaproteobacteria bacterium]
MKGSSYFFPVAAVLIGAWLAGLAAPALAASPSQKLHALVCERDLPSASSSSSWHITNLYDCQTHELYIPYHLWTGASWDGRKERPCMHAADHTFAVNGKSRTRIRGPFDWNNPRTGTTHRVWKRVKLNGSKRQYFTCHEKGIGRVYDSRGKRYWPAGRCKFPAGFGWKVGERRFCHQTSIEIDRVRLDRKGNLKDVRFKWWVGSRLDHVYLYAPGRGMRNAWKK